MQKEMDVDPDTDLERERRITKQASELSKQIQVKCMSSLMDQVRDLALSGHLVTPIKEVQVGLHIAIITGLGTRAEASNDITIMINPKFLDVKEKESER